MFVIDIEPVDHWNLVEQFYMFFSIEHGILLVLFLIRRNIGPVPSSVQTHLLKQQYLQEMLILTTAPVSDSGSDY